MRQQLAITIALSIFLACAALLKILYFPKLYGQSAYYFICIFWICGILITILSVNLMWRFCFRRRASPSGKNYAGWTNRRNTFRIVYPTSIRPVMVIEKADNQPIRQLEFPVVDLSQGGSCFLDDGSLGKIHNFSGYILFSNGDRIRVTGKSIRKDGNQVSVQFSDAIQWATLLTEQRRVLAQMKSSLR